MSRHRARGVVGVSGLGECPLVLGECVQGRMPSGCHFLITAPLGLFSWARFSPDPDLDGVAVDPQERTKSAKAVADFLGERDLPPGGRLSVSTPVAPAQGFGTSTADIVASIRAAAAAWSRTVSPAELARLAIRIEPTDGSMYPGCVAFAHRTGVILERLGEPPPFEVVVLLDEDGQIDTAAFDPVRCGFVYTREEEGELLRAWALVRRANRTGHTATLARATTESARINQRFLPKPFFGELDLIVREGCAEGLIAAHSGTFTALVLDPARRNHGRRLERIYRLLEELGVRSWLHLSNRERWLGPSPGTSGGESAVTAGRGARRPRQDGDRAP